MEEDLLIAKVLDKQKYCLAKNKITYTDFLNHREKMIIQKSVKIKNCFWYGVNENADREILVFYPDKLNEEIARRGLSKIVSVIRIVLPNDLRGEYEHRNYLSALMKIGLAREKIGDILVDYDGADIVTFDINKDYVMQSLGQLTRFKKAIISQVSLENARKKEDKFTESTIIISSMRIDNVISEIARCSRSKAEELIKQEKVFVNYEEVLKNSQNIDMGDIITVRGVGKFIVDGLVRNTRNDRLVIKIKKYV